MIRVPSSSITLKLALVAELSDVASLFTEKVTIKAPLPLIKVLFMAA